MTQKNNETMAITNAISYKSQIWNMGGCGVGEEVGVKWGVGEWEKK